MKVDGSGPACKCTHRTQTLFHLVITLFSVYLISCDAFVVKKPLQHTNDDDSGKIGFRRDLAERRGHSSQQQQGNSRRSRLPGSGDIRDLLSSWDEGGENSTNTTNSTNPTNSTNSTNPNPNPPSNSTNSTNPPTPTNSTNSTNPPTPTNSTNSTAAPSPFGGDSGSGDSNSTDSPTDSPTPPPTGNSTAANTQPPTNDSSSGDNSSPPTPKDTELTLSPTSSQSSDSGDGDQYYMNEPTFSTIADRTPSPTDSPTQSATTRTPSKSPIAGFLNSEEEELKRLAKDKTADILAILLAVFGLLGMILTAWQILENPDGLCTSCCRLVVKASSFFLKVLFLPCKLCCTRSKGYTGPNPSDPNTSMFVGSEQFNNMEMT